MQSGGRRWLLPPVRRAHKQDRGHALLEKRELEFFKVNAIACVLQPLRHILRGTIIARRTGGSVATANGGDMLKRQQVTEDTLACHGVERAGSASDEVFRPGDVDWRDGSKQRGGEADTPACTKGL